MIAFGMWILPTSWSSAPNSAPRRVSASTPSWSATRQRQLDHVLGVIARVLVVGLDHVAQQQRGAAIGLRELQRVVDPRLALAREEREQRDEREHEHAPRRAAAAAPNAASSPTGREQRVDAVDERQLVADRGGPDAEREPRAQRREQRVAAELGHERERVPRQRRPRRASARRRGRGRARAAPRTRRPRRAAIVRWAEPVATHRLDRVGQHVRGGDEQRDERRREQQEHRDEHDLRRDDDARAGGELDARHDRVGDDEQRGEQRVEARARRAPERERDGGEDERGAEAGVRQRSRRPARAAFAHGLGEHRSTSGAVASWHRQPVRRSRTHVLSSRQLSTPT